MQKIVPFLRFDGQAEEAMNFYVAIFKNSKIRNAATFSTISFVPGPPPPALLPRAREQVGN